MLLNAFTRALRDSFPPARVAGLKAIVATAKYHSPDDAAVRVLPAVGPLCVDAVHEVRGSALACLEHFSKVLKAHHAELEKKAAQQAAEAANDKSSGAAPGTSGGSSLLNSFGWAASSLGLGRSAAPEAAKPAVPVAGGQPAAAAPAAAAPAASAAAAAPAAAEGVSSPPKAVASSNGWDADDDLLEDMVDEVSAGMALHIRMGMGAIAQHCFTL